MIVDAFGTKSLARVQWQRCDSRWLAFFFLESSRRNKSIVLFVVTTLIFHFENVTETPLAISQPAYQSANQSANQPANQPANRPVPVIRQGERMGPVQLYTRVPCVCMFCYRVGSPISVKLSDQDLVET